MDGEKYCNKHNSSLPTIIDDEHVEYLYAYTRTVIYNNNIQNRKSINMLLKYNGNEKGICQVLYGILTFRFI